MSYSNIVGHRSMVFDHYRNAAYVRAMEKVIGPETAVMDLGAGLGVHGFNAAKLGAARVLLVEPASVIEVAREIAADNQFGNVECFPSRVEELQLDEKVDVIVSVFTGNFLLTEDLLPSLFHARDKYLAPGGKLIPDRARMEVVPVSAPDYYQKHVQIWSDSTEYCAEQNLPEVDYSRARQFAANTLYYDTADRFQAEPLAQPARLIDMDFNTATQAACDSETVVEIIQDGICHGWLGWFQIHLVDEWLSTGSEADATHWSQVFLPLQEPIEVNAGEQLRFALKRPEFGEWTWTTQHGEQKQRLSTFLSQPLSHQRLMKASDNYQPSLSESGEAAQWLLVHMNGAEPTGQLASRLCALYPKVFFSEAEALKFVKDLAERYA
jgi:predicted RNA methylase